MKDPNGFDELARRKLAERDFAFDQSHWTDMERLLAERDRKPKTWWPWTAAGVLLLGGATLWSVMNEDAVSLPDSNGPVVERKEQVRTIEEAASTAQDGSQVQPSVEAAERDLAHTGSSVVDRGDIGTNARDENPPSKESAGEVRARPSKAPEPRVREVSATTNTSQTLKRRATDDVTTSTGGAPSDPVVLPVNSAEQKGMAPDPNRSGVVSPTRSTMATTAAGTDITPVAEAQETAIDQEGVKTAVTVAEDPGNTSTTTVETPPVATDAGSSGEEPAITNTPEPNTPAAAPPPAPPAWLAVRTPFELSLLGGAFSTTVNYRGDGTGSWKASTERQNTMGLGIEGVWNIGTHFGLGLGAHYSSYREQLITEELTRIDQTLTNSYFWTLYDTLVVTVTGTDTIGGIIYNITELVPMTISQLSVDTDTSYSTTLLRERRSVTNTVNYVEIPLLLDAHTSCGRWVFGVRGGPTIGLLTSRQGSVPNEGGSGYTDLSDRTFRSMTLGCMARAYARYRLNNAWSIGLEPTWRQQLGNAFGGAEVQRRGNAFGGYLSISYRFPAKSTAP